MTDANLPELSQNILGFEINHFSHVNRVLNKIERGEVSDIDTKIMVLKILVTSLNENRIIFNTLKNQRNAIRRFLGIFVPIAKRLGLNPDYKGGLLSIHNGFESYIKGTTFSRIQCSHRESVTRILNTSTERSYASASDRVQGRSVRV